MTRQMIMDNVYLTYIPSEKFKTSFLSAQMVMPMKKETAGLNALLINVLSRGTVRCPDMAAMSRQLDLLYGARLEPVVRKKGEEAKVAIRNLRRDANEHVKRLLKDKEISEDDQKRSEKDIQKLTDNFIAQVDTTVANKEKEVMTI